MILASAGETRHAAFFVDDETAYDRFAFTSPAGPRHLLAHTPSVRRRAVGGRVSDQWAARARVHACTCKSSGCSAACRYLRWEVGLHPRRLLALALSVCFAVVRLDPLRVALRMVRPESRRRRQDHDRGGVLMACGGRFRMAPGRIVLGHPSPPGSLRLRRLMICCRLRSSAEPHGCEPRRNVRKGYNSDAPKKRIAAVLLLCVVAITTAAPIRAGVTAQPTAQSAAREENFDVVVYGATPGGIVAAVAAARGGARTILLEPTRHVGGLSTSGINTAELDTCCAGFGGVSLSLLRAARTHVRKASRSSSRVALRRGRPQRTAAEAKGTVASVCASRRREEGRVARLVLTDTGRWGAVS